MRANYDKPSDTLTMTFSTKPVAESDEVRPGVILDYAADGSVVGLEILQASQRTDAPSSLEFAVAA